LKEVTSEVLHFEHNLKLGHFGKLDQKCLKSFEMWCWRRMEIRWTDRVRGII